MSSQMLTSKFGGELISFKVDGEERIHQGENCTDENGKVYWKRHAPILFPIVGKLKKNQTVINGKEYEMTQHGFARDMEFEPITKLDNYHSYVLKSNEYTLARYPYNFSLYTTYRTEANKLTTIYRVTNNGEYNMPFGIGGHPAFKIDMQDLINEEYYLEFEEEESKIHFLYLIDGLIGREYAKNILQDKKIIPITPSSFDNDAIIMKGLSSKKISLKKKTGNGSNPLAFATLPLVFFFCLYGLYISSTSARVSAFANSNTISSVSFPWLSIELITSSFLRSKFLKYVSLSSSILNCSSLKLPVTSFLYLAMNGIVFPSSINSIVFFTCVSFTFNSVAILLTMSIILSFLFLFFYNKKEKVLYFSLHFLNIISLFYVKKMLLFY